MDYSIIRDGAELNKAVTLVIKNGKTYRDRLHVAAVSALFHAAEHGQPEPLNRIYFSLTDNDKQALKNYIRRAAAIIGLGDVKQVLEMVKPDVLKAAVDIGTWLRFKNETGFEVIKNSQVETVKAAKAGFMSLAESHLINPDGKQYKRFFDRFVITEIKVLSGSTVLDTMTKTIKEVKAGNTDKREVQVYPEELALMETFEKDMRRLVELRSKPAENVSAEPAVAAN